jgi:hypothetical protein
MQAVKVFASHIPGSAAAQTMFGKVKHLVNENSSISHEDKLAIKAGHCALEGSLQKMGFVNTAWKTRYFCLQNGYLYYFKSMSDARAGEPPRGKINIKGAVCSSVTASDFLDIQHGQFTFSVKTSAHADDKLYLLKATSNEIRIQWRGAIEAQQAQSKHSVAKKLFVPPEFWRKEGSCSGCHKKFTMTRRRHHCRADGHAYCQKCAIKFAVVHSGEAPVRVCNKCYKQLKMGKNLEEVYNFVNSENNSVVNAEDYTGDEENNAESVEDEADSDTESVKEHRSDGEEEETSSHQLKKPINNNNYQRGSASKPITVNNLAGNSRNSLNNASTSYSVSPNPVNRVVSSPDHAVQQSSIPSASPANHHSNNYNNNSNNISQISAKKPAQGIIMNPQGPSSWLDNESDYASLVPTGQQGSINSAQKGPALKSSYVSAAKNPVHRVSATVLSPNSSSGGRNNGDNSGSYRGIQTPTGISEGRTAGQLGQSMQQRPAPSVLVHEGYTHLEDDGDKNCCSKCVLQ